MKAKAIFLLVILFFFTLPSPLKAQAPFSPLDIRFGAVEAFRAPEAASEAGVGWERVVFWWRELQPNGPDEWNAFYFPDSELQRELESGREVVGMIANAPDWANDRKGTAGVPQGLYLPLDDPGNLWANFVRKIVERYKGRIDRWVIWNEPDVWQQDHPGYTWNGTVEDYYQLLKVAYLVAKEVNPNCKIHLAGLTFWWDTDYGRELYFERLLKVIAQDPTAPEHNYYFDVVTLHLYFQSQSAFDMPAHVHRVMKEQYAFDKPVWINECNAPPSEDPLDPVGHPRFRVRLEDQANFILQAFALGLAGGAERISVYKMADKPKPPGSLEPYGLVRADDSRRPAYYAYKVATKHLSGARSAELYRDGPFWERPVDRVTVDRGNKTTTVIWNWRQEERTVTLPAIAPQAILVDNQGNEKIIKPVRGLYTLHLPANVCIDPGGCLMGGEVFLLVEEGPTSKRGSLIPPKPTRTPTQTATPTETSTPAPTSTPSPTSTPTKTLTPTITPTDTPVPTYTPTVTPTPIPPPSPESKRFLRFYIFIVIAGGMLYFSVTIIWHMFRKNQNRR